MPSPSQIRRAERDEKNRQERIALAEVYQNEARIPIDSTEEVMDAAKQLAKHFGRPANKQLPRRKVAANGKNRG